MEEFGFKEPFKVLPSTRHLHHTSACLAARGSDTTCQKSWQCSDALMEPNVPQQIRDGRVLMKALLMHRSCRTAAGLCDGIQRPLSAAGVPLWTSPLLPGIGVYMQWKEYSKEMVNSFKVDVFLMSLVRVNCLCHRFRTVSSISRKN